MAENPNVNVGPDGLEEVTVTATRPFQFDLRGFSEHINLSKMSGYNLLRSCKFAIHMLRHPNCLSGTDVKGETTGYRNAQLREFTFLCDSLELPGRTAVTTEFQIPGQQKIKAPYRKEFNEITLSFYHDTRFPMYQYFNDWLDNISFTSTQNAYFDDSVIDLNLIQFRDDHTRYKTVSLFNAYPLTVSSLPCNWADDGFHKLQVTMFYEYAGSSNNAWRETTFDSFKENVNADLRDLIKEFESNLRNPADSFNDYRPAVMDLNLGE